MSFLRIGDDGARIMFETPSSVPGETHELHLERSTGALHCSCPDAQCRSRIGHLLEPQAGCKHARGFHGFWTDTLRATVDGGGE